MAPVSNRFAKYIIQPDTAGGGSAPAPKANRFAKYKAGEAPAVQQANPMVAQGQAAQQAWRDGGAKPANPNPENPIITAQRGSQTASMSQWAADRRAEANAPQDEIDRRKDAYRQKYGPDVKFAGPGFTADPNDRAEEALSVRSIISAANTVPGTVNAILEGSDTMFGSGRHFDQMTGEELQFSNSPKPQQADPVRVTFGDRGAGNGTGLPPPAVEPTRYLPQLNLSPATSVAEMGADMTGELGAYVVMPGKVIDLGFKAAGAAVRGLGPVGRAVTAITPQGAGVVDKSLRYGGRMVSTVPENAAHAFAFGAMAGEDGSRMETGAQFAADPLNYLAQPVASLIQRAGVALKTMGARVTPKAVQLQQAMQTLQRGNATPEQVRQAVATINKITPPRPAETAPLAGAADEAPGAQNAPAPVQGRSDAAIGAAKQQAETRAQLQAALDAANARGDREAAAQLESQLRDSTFIIDPQTGQRAGAATRAAQPQPIPTATQTAAGAPPIQPPPPAVASANAAVPTPGVVPPAGNLVPIPQNEAVAAFNALPPKTREAMLRTLNSAGMDANGFWSDTWRKLTGRFRNSSEAMDAIRKLGDMPEDQQVMFALQLIKNNGGDLETILPAMGRKWATEGARDPQLFGGTDRAREIMDANVPKVINSQGERVAGIAEDKFGPGIVPAGEAIDVEKRVLAKQYDTLLNPQRKQYGRLRNPQKLASIDKAWNDIKAYLKRPEVIDQMPDWVKLKVMQRASEDMRNIGFTDAEMSTILAGDGAVLAPLFEASGPLTWSPQMWTHLVDQYPTQAAHVLQSAYREAADGLMSGVSRTQADVTNAQYLMRLRGESGKGGLVDMLERAIPGKGGKIDGEGGYQWTRTNFGDNRSAERAFDILERFKTAANSEGDVAAIIKELKNLPARHRDAAENQITSLIRQELGRKVDNAKLSELDSPDRLSAPNLTALSNQNFLNALEDVFGQRGKELADGIRLARASTDTLTSISPKYNSRTQLNAEDVKNAGARYEDPAGAEGGVIDKTVGGLASGGLATGGAAALGISAAGGLTVPLLGLAAGKALYNAYKAGKRLSNTERNQLVDFLFRARKAGEGDPLPRKINHGNVLRSAAVNAAVGGTIGGLSSEGDPNAIAAGIVGGAGFGAARKIIRSRSSLIKPPGPVGPRLGPRGPATPVNALRGPGGSTPPSSPTNALATPPRPPVRSGFGSSKPLDMSEAGRMQRAREQGFDVEYPLYHGSRKGGGFDEFQTSERGRFGPGVYFSEQPTVAGKYGEAKPYVVPTTDQLFDAMPRWNSLTSDAEQRIIKQLRPHEKEKLLARKDWYKREGEAFWEALRRAVDGEDGVLADARASEVIQAAGFKGIRGIGDGQETVIFDPKNIRRTDAAFDPSQSGSSKLLAGMPAGTTEAGLGVGGGIYGAANPVDWDGDGTITDEERRRTIMSYGVGGMMSPSLARPGLRAVGAAKKAATLPKTSTAAGRWKADLKGNQWIVRDAQGNEIGRTSRSFDATPEEAIQAVELRNSLRPKGPPTGPAQATFGGSKQPLPMDGGRGSLIEADAINRIASGKTVPTSAELDDALKGLREAEFDDLVRQFGGDRQKAEKFRSLWRQAERASTRQEGDMLDAQRQKLIEGMPDVAPREFVDEYALRQLRDAFREIENGNAIGALTDSLTDLPTLREVQGGQMNSRAQAALAILRKATQEARLQGSDPAQMLNSALEQYGRRFSDPADAEFMVGEVKKLVAAFDPSQSGSSKLLAGMGASPEGLGAAAGGAAGYIANPTDANGDGVIDDADRGLNAMGGLISGGVAVKGARMGVGAAKSGANALRNAGRGAKAEAPRGSFGGRSNAASTISENQAIRNQLVDLRSERPRATPERQAEIDEEVAALNGMLGDETPASPKPTQAGFLPSGSGKPGAKPPANALAGPPKKPAPVLSRAAEEATRELKAARRAYNTAANKWVMKDDRELRVKPLEDRVVAAEAKLAQVLKNDARLKTIAARGHALMRSDDLRVPLGLAAAGTGVLTAGVLGYNALAPKKAAEAPMSAKDPRFYWSTIQNNEDAMARIQMALGQWDEWPEDAEMTGTYGKVTKQALKSWRFSKGLDPEAPMSQKDVERLLAGPKGYQDRDGKKWRYGADGEQVSAP